MATKTKAAPDITLPALKKGEHYAGVIIADGKLTHHVVLLAGEITKTNHAGAVKWAKGKKGELPTRREQALLFANLPLQFKSDYYWSGDQHASDADYAWGQDFGYGDQTYWHKSVELRARAVRRVVI